MDLDFDNICLHTSVGSDCDIYFCYLPSYIIIIITAPAYSGDAIAHHLLREGREGLGGKADGLEGGGEGEWILKEE